MAVPSSRICTPLPWNLPGVSTVPVMVTPRRVLRRSKGKRRPIPWPAGIRSRHGHGNVNAGLSCGASNTSPG